MINYLLCSFAISNRPAISKRPDKVVAKCLLVIVIRVLAFIIKQPNKLLEVMDFALFLSRCLKHYFRTGNILIVSILWAAPSFNRGLWRLSYCSYFCCFLKLVLLDLFLPFCLLVRMWWHLYLPTLGCFWKRNRIIRNKCCAMPFLHVFFLFLCFDLGLLDYIL